MSSLLLTGGGLPQVQAAQVRLGQATLAQTRPEPRSDYRNRLPALLPAAGQTLSLMQIRQEVSSVALERYISIRGGDVRVLQAILKTTQIGEVPKYDVRYGIPEQDFQRFLAFRPRLFDSGRTFKLALNRDGNRLTFADMPLAPSLRGLSLDLNTGELRTAEGFTARPVVVEVSALSDVTGLGARSGLTWAVRGTNPTTYNAVDGHFSLLQLSGGVYLISYNRTVIQKGRVSEDSVNIQYRK